MRHKRLVFIRSPIATMLKAIKCNYRRENMVRHLTRHQYNKQHRHNKLLREHRTYNTHIIQSLTIHLRHHDTSLHHNIKPLQQACLSALADIVVDKPHFWVKALNVVRSLTSSGTEFHSQALRPSQLTESALAQGDGTATSDRASGYPLRALALAEELCQRLWSQTMQCFRNQS